MAQQQKISREEEKNLIHQFSAATEVRLMKGELP
jgi:hypothetical protein